jgi:hypothetical protein
MSLKLIPNNFQVVRMPHGRRLQALGGIQVLMTLLPVAMPSSTFLRTFRGFQRPAPTYPNFLCDCESLEPVDSLTWDALYGGAVACGIYGGDRILISTRKQGTPRGIAEFDREGHLVGHQWDTGHITKMVGTITSMISASKHVACCGSTGYVMIIQEDKTAEPTVRHGRRRYPWQLQPLFVSAFHDASIICGCALVHAGLDFFFFVSKNNEICVAVLDNGECFRCAVNNSFFIASIRSITACSPYLYIALSDGAVYVLNLSPILEDGDIDSIGYLHRFIVLHESVFANRSGIASMCACSPSSFLSLKNEDEQRSNVMANNSLNRSKTYKYLEKPVDDQYMQEHLEGHLLLFGGGDADPVIKVCHPRAGGIRELVSLTGHNTAVTQIVADACMRYIISASGQERKILIWDGHTFTCERIIEDISIGALSVGEDCMVVTTSKAPFLRIWNVPRNKNVVATNKPRVLDGSLDTMVHLHDERRCRDIESECGIPYHSIVALRSAAWCYAMLKGGFKPKKSIEIPKYLDPVYVQVIWRWGQQYLGSRMDAAESLALVKQRKLDRHNRLNKIYGRSLNHLSAGDMVSTAGAFFSSGRDSSRTKKLSVLVGGKPAELWYHLHTRGQWQRCCTGIFLA